MTHSKGSLCKVMEDTPGQGDGAEAAAQPTTLGVSSWCRRGKQRAAQGRDRRCGKPGGTRGWVIRDPEEIPRGSHTEESIAFSRTSNKPGVYQGTKNVESLGATSGAKELARPSLGKLRERR